MKQNQNRTPYHAYVLGRYCAADAWIELLRLGVLAPFRRQGIARKMLLHIESVIASSLCKAKRIIIELREQNHSARNLYTASGYRVIASRRAYYSDNDSAVVMEKILFP